MRRRVERLVEPSTDHRPAAVVKSRSSAWSLALASGLFAACSAQSAAAPRPAAARATPGPVAEAPAHVDVLPTYGFRVLHLPSAGDEQRAIIGSQRFTAQAGQMRWASSVFGEEIIAAAECEHGFSFVAVDGAIATSETFLGPLRRLGDLAGAFYESAALRATLAGGPQPGYFHVGRDSAGMLPMVDRDGRLWLADGRRLTEATTLPAPAREAEFVSASLGVAVLDDGSVALTRDRGQSWSRVPPGTDAYWHVSVDAGRAILHGTSGLFALGDDGTLAPVAPRPPPSRPERPSWGGAVLSRGSPFNALTWSELGVLTDDGETASCDDEGLRFVDQETGRVRRVALPGVAGSCHVFRWGPGALRVSTFTALWRTERDGSSVEPIELPGEAHAHEVLWSDDGRRGALRGRCGASRYEVSEGLCVLGLDGRWTSTDLTTPDDALVALHGGRLLLLRRAARDEGGERELVWLDLDSRAEERVRLQRGVRLSGAHLVRLFDDSMVLLATGTFVADEAGESRDAGSRGGEDGESNTSFLLVGDPEDELRYRALPPRVLGVDFLDGRHGVAAGASLADLYRTVDGGGAWERVVVPTAGDPSTVPLGMTGAGFETSVRCELGRCLAGQRVLVRGLGRTLATANDIVAATRPGERSSAAGEAGDVGDAGDAGDTGDAAAQRPSLSLRCTGSAPASHAAPARHATAALPSRAAPGVERMTTHEGRSGVEWEARWSRGSRARVRARWSGVDERGSFAAQGAGDVELAAAAQGASGSTERSPEVRVLRATREALFVRRCTEYLSVCSVLLFRPGGGVRVFNADIVTPPDPPDRLTEPYNAVMTRDGHVVIAWSTSGLHFNGLVTVFDPSGRLIARRLGFQAPTQWSSALRFVPGGDGVELLRWNAAQQQALPLVPAGDATPLEPAWHTRALPLCVGAAAPGAAQFSGHLERSVAVFSAGPSGRLEGRIDAVGLEQTGATTCLRSASMTVYIPAQQGTGAVQLESGSGGELRGTVTTGQSTSQIVCTVEARPR